MKYKYINRLCIAIRKIFFQHFDKYSYSIKKSIQNVLQNTNTATSPHKNCDSIFTVSFSEQFEHDQTGGA
jgi:hypothetical protein